MNPQPANEFARFALGLPGAWPDSPWEGDHVAKVDEKIFCFLGGDSIGVKAAASKDEASHWIDRYPQDAAVMAYIGRHGWVTLKVDGTIGKDELFDAITDSYRLVVEKLPKSRRPEGWQR